MVIKNYKKILSSIMLTAYIMVLSAPIGLCVSSVPTINAEIKKPALRESGNPSMLKLEGDISISKYNPKVNLSLRNSDVQQVLRMFADKAGLNIIFHNSVSGNVTLDLVNVPLNDAFKLIMQVTSLTYYIDNNTMVVMSSSSAQTMNIAKQDLMILPVKYVDAAIMATFLNKNIFSINKPGLSNSDIAVTNPNTNEVLIFGTKNDYLMAKKVIAQFDVKPKEETFIVNHTTPKEMANLVCDVLMKNHYVPMSGSGGSSSGASFGNSPSSTTSPGNSPSATPSAMPSAMPRNSLPGLPTGGAASAAGSSSGSSSSSGGSSAIELGAGVIACQYSNAVTAGPLASFEGNSVSIAYFPQRGTIQVIGGSSQQIEMIKDFINKNDKKQPQAYLEISIIELNETGSRDFTNTWNVWSRWFSGTFGGSLSNQALYPTFLKGDSYKVVDASDATKVLAQAVKYADSPILTYAINYSISNTKGRVLANPRIMITNGQTSTIDLSADYIKTVKSEVLTTSGVQGVTQKTYEIGSDEGIKVELIPFISPDGYVTLNIKPDYVSQKEKVYATGTDSTTKDLVATLMQRRNLDLKNVRIKDGETLVIGGMIREIETKTVEKIPVLGDLPGVGFFFRNSNTAKEKEELVIMITPKIIKETEDIVNNTGVAL